MVLNTLLISCAVGVVVVFVLFLSYIVFTLFVSLLTVMIRFERANTTVMHIEGANCKHI